jgi:hypothetical protein
MSSKGLLEHCRGTVPACGLHGACQVALLSEAAISCRGAGEMATPRNTNGDRKELTPGYFTKQARHERAFPYAWGVSLAWCTVSGHVDRAKSSFTSAYLLLLCPFTSIPAVSIA